jgi:AraC-like DNA-binding protein
LPCDPDLLFRAIAIELDARPHLSLAELSRTFSVSRGMIGKAVASGSGVTFRKFQENVLMNKIRHDLLSKPTFALKELSFDLGFKSPHSFARFIKRVTGQCPHELRSALAENVNRAVELDRSTHLKERHRREMARKAAV